MRLMQTGVGGRGRTGSGGSAHHDQAQQATPYLNITVASRVV